MTTFTLVNRNAANTTVNGISGATYTSDASGFITNVAQLDVAALLASGWVVASQANSDSPGNIPVTQLGLSDAKTSNGLPLSASAPAGGFAVTMAVASGGSQFLTGEAANSGAKTDVFVKEWIVPGAYIVGQPISATINAQLNGSGTVTTNTLELQAFPVVSGGTMLADQSPGSAYTLSSGGSAQDITTVISGGVIVPNQKVMLKGTAIVHETAGSNMTAQINSLRVQA